MMSETGQPIDSSADHVTDTIPAGAPGDAFADIVGKALRGVDIGAESTQSDRARDLGGRFAKKESGDEGASQVAVGQPAGQDPAKDEGKGTADAQGRNAPGSGVQSDSETKSGAREPVSLQPPGGWSPTAKAAYAGLPPEVKQAIADRETQVSSGFKQYEGLKEVLPYQEHYAKQGGSVKQTLDSYSNVDRMLGTDFPAGIAVICEHFGIRPADLGRVLSGAQGQQPQPGASQSAGIDPALSSRIGSIEQFMAQQQQAEQQRQRDAALSIENEARQTISSFSAEKDVDGSLKYPYFDNVKEPMGRLIQAGQAKDIPDAYDQACWANPEIRKLLITRQQAQAQAQTQARQQAAATQARQSAQSVTGSPMPGGITSVGKSKPNSIETDVLNAIRSQGARV